MMLTFGKYLDKAPSRQYAEPAVQEGSCGIPAMEPDAVRTLQLV